MREPTISIYFIKAVLRYVPPEQQRALLLQNRISPALMTQSSARVQAEDYANLIRDTMLLKRDEALGYGTAAQRPGSWEIMCHSVIGAENLGEAMERLARFYRLIEWGLMSQLTEDNESAFFSMTPKSPAPEIEHYIYESFLFYVHRIANWLIARQIPLQSVEFHFARPEHAEEYRPMYLAAPVLFDRPRSQFSFARSYLEQPIRQTQKSLREFLRHPNYAMIVQQYDQRSWHYKVKTLLSRELANNPSLQDVAAQLHQHPQTLRRHLQKEGFQYQEIKAQVRRDTAIYLLSNRHTSVEETAQLTGFSEASSFIRSFRKWTGVTPYTYRKS